MRFIAPIIVLFACGLIACDSEETEEVEEVDEVQQSEETGESEEVDEVDEAPQQGDRPDEMQHAWQLETPEVAGGQMATYKLHDDGLFIYVRGGTDRCQPGVTTRVGTWHMDGDELVLKEERNIEEVGGEKVDDDLDGCILEGAETQVSEHSEPEVTSFQVTECSDEEHAEHETYYDELGSECRRFDDVPYWTSAAMETTRWADEWEDWFDAAE